MTRTHNGDKSHYEVNKLEDSRLGVPSLWLVSLICCSVHRITQLYSCECSIYIAEYVRLLINKLKSGHPVS